MEVAALGRGVELSRGGVEWSSQGEPCIGAILGSRGVKLSIGVVE